MRQCHSPETGVPLAIMSLDQGTRDMVQACHLGSDRAREWCEMLDIDWRSYAPPQSWRFVDVVEET